jgi:hypothetical protein
MPAAGPATATSRYQPLLLLSATVTAVTPTLLVTASTRHLLRRMSGPGRIQHHTCGSKTRSNTLCRDLKRKMKSNLHVMHVL